MRKFWRNWSTSYGTENLSAQDCSSKRSISTGNRGRKVTVGIEVSPVVLVKSTSRADGRSSLLLTMSRFTRLCAGGSNNRRAGG